MFTCRHCGLPIPRASRAAVGDLFCCFGCRIAFDVALPSLGAGAAPSTLFLRLGLGLFLTMNIMALSWFSYSREWFGEVARAEGFHTGLVGLFSYLILFLCTAVLALLGLPLLGEALRDLKQGRVTAPLLISLGVFSAYLLSVIHTVQGQGSLYYDTTAVVLVIVTLGSYLEAGAKRRAASSAGMLLASLPDLVRLRRDGALLDLPRAEIRVGDQARVLPGETIPVDGQITDGASHLDESSLTGESLPRPVAEGDRVLAGTDNLDGQLWIDVQQTSARTVLAQMEQCLERARAEQPPIQRLADRVAAVFVPGVVVLAVTVFVIWTRREGFDAGLMNSLSVLLISCPCALGLAAPLATWNALRRAADQGILVDSSATLERAASVRHVLFDKTGTLTHPHWTLDRIWTAHGVEGRQALEWAASLESSSTHPLARALLVEASRRDVPIQVPESARTVQGRGIEGVLDGRRLRLGSAVWLADDEDKDEEEDGEKQDDGSRGGLVLADEERILARFGLEETPRGDAGAAIEKIRGQGMTAGILSGDRDRATQRVAKRLGIAARGGLLPEDKLRHLTRLRETRNQAVAMVGDGLNDAPVLAAADVGIALGSASDLAQRSGNVRLMSDRLDRIPLLFDLARQTRRKIRANLAWAFGFNSVGLVLASLGLLTPVFSAVAMVASSLMVVRISSA